MAAIVNHEGRIAFELNVQKKTYTFSHEGLKQWITDGIRIPPYLRPSFDNKKVVYPPAQSASSAEYEQFKEAICFLYKNELNKHGFKFKELEQESQKE